MEAPRESLNPSGEVPGPGSGENPGSRADPPLRAGGEAMLRSLLLALLASAAAPQELLTPAAQRSDLRYLRAVLENHHAGYDRYTPRAELGRRFGAVEAALDAPCTPLELYLLLAPLVDAIGDGHTQLKAPAEAYRRVNAGRHFPLQVLVTAGGIWVHHVLTDAEAPPPGAELLAIDGVEVAEIRRRMLALETSDGSVLTDKLHKLSNPVRFSFHYQALFPGTERFELDWRAPGSPEVRTTTVAGLTIQEVNAARRRIDRDRDLLELRWEEDVPVLRVGTFAHQHYSAAGVDFDAALVRVFRELAERGARALILDVRDNGGGTDAHVVALAAHLLEGPFTLYRAVTLPTCRLPVSAAGLRLVGGLRPFEELEVRAGAIHDDGLRALPDGTWSCADHPNLRPVAPREPRFDGRVIVLQNGGSYSATGELTSLLHHAGRATFVGEEGGAGYYGSSSGAFAAVTLPRSGLRVDVPLVRYELRVAGYEPRDRGLVPDHPVETTIEDLLGGRDPVLARGLELARE